MDPHTVPIRYAGFPRFSDPRLADVARLLIHAKARVDRGLVRRASHGHALGTLLCCALDTPLCTAYAATTATGRVLENECTVRRAEERHMIGS